MHKFPSPQHKKFWENENCQRMESIHKFKIALYLYNMKMSSEESAAEQDIKQCHPMSTLGDLIRHRFLYNKKANTGSNYLCLEENS